jgi:predicted phosphodiesterase
MHRRDFLIGSGLSLGALSLPERLLADPYAPLPRLSPSGTAIRIRGRVTGNGRPLSGVRVSDGLSVVQTGSDGRYTLVSDSAQPFVFVSTPSGWQPARNPTGTARFYQPIVSDMAEQRADFALEARANDKSHSLLVLADPQTEVKYETDLLHAETVPDVVQTVQRLGERAVVGIACGDIMFDNLDLYPEYERAVQRMGVPFYQVIGNHDLDFASRTTEGAIKTFSGLFGPQAYSFDLGAVRYIVLNNVFWHGAGYVGYVDGRQLAWMANDLATLEKGRTVVVLEHIPAMSTSDSRNTGARNPSASNAQANRQALYRMLEGYKAYIVAGHMHEFERNRDGGVEQIVAGAVCGAWWSGPICYDGTPNGYLVLNGDDEQVSWQYKSTGLAVEQQMRLYGRGGDSTAPDEICANVWAADESWRVTWIEDGEPRGLMSRRTGRDPLSVTLHQGADKPLRRTWVDPARTNHLYYATPSPSARSITVEARDPWGRSYRETIALG